jgi:2-C-methyl-D-erythritol 4-phosphate cytidylyltransferase
MTHHPHAEIAYPRPGLAGLIAAAGAGTRLGLGPKAFLQLGGRTLLERVVSGVRQVAGEVAVALPPPTVSEWQGRLPGVCVIAGGATRQETYARLLGAVKADWIMTQDVTRPFASPALMIRVVEAALSCGAAGAFLACPVPVARIEGGLISGHLRSRDAMLPQCPSVFRRDLFERALAEGGQEQTIWQLALNCGIPIRPVEGEPGNIKITGAADWEMARRLVRDETGLQGTQA